jgi:hypothetical protein
MYANMKFGMRGAIVVVAICSWFAISNHCAFAALATKTGSAQRGCPFHAKPAKQGKQSTGAQCCKTLRAVASIANKSWARDDAKLSGADGYYVKPALTIAFSATAPMALDTGPPDGRSFAELVLQQSLRAHAPPALA